MELICLNWSTIFENSISGLISGLVVGLIVGLILARKGYKIWKQQFFYQKRLKCILNFYLIFLN